jgi:hypothetical protein
MQSVTELLAAIPGLRAQGLLGLSGGTLGLRASEGVYVTPFQAALELDWQIAAEDLVLFPGGGEASMARAGRRPCIDNRLHRIILNANKSWTCSYVGNMPGLLSFAIAGQLLELPHEYSALFQKNPRIEAVPVTNHLPLSSVELQDQMNSLLAEQFSRSQCGALLIGGYGCVVAGANVQTASALFLVLERLALAQQWKLALPRE